MEPTDLTPENLRRLCASEVRELIAGVASLAQAHEGSLWWLDRPGEQLVIVVNSGPRASSLEGVVSQPIGTGQVSVAFRENKPVNDTGLFQPATRNPAVDEALGQTTQNQIAVPVRLGGKPHGVLTLVQLTAPGLKPPTHWGFGEQQVGLAELAALAIGHYLRLAGRSA